MSVSTGREENSSAKRVKKKVKLSNQAVKSVLSYLIIIALDLGAAAVSSAP